MQILDALVSRAGYSLQRDNAYGSAPRQKYDLYRPEAEAGGAPLIVFFYGGAWQSGSKDLYRFAAQPFAARGFFVAVPDYRLAPEVAFPVFVEDAAKAVLAVWKAQRQADGSPRRLILIGHSAGAHIAALLAFDEHYLEAAGLPPGSVSAFVGISGPYDFLPLTDPQYFPIFPEATRADSQPINFVDGAETPALLLAGDADRTVDPGNSIRLARRIREKGGRVQMKLYPGSGHIGTILALASFLPGKRPPVLEDIFAFLGRPLPAAVR